MRLFTFKKGVHPKEYKHFTEGKAIEELPLPEEVFIPLTQHIGKPSQPMVKKKDLVKTGQLIGKADGPFSANIHASVTGKVVNVGLFMHPMGSRVPMVHIKREGDEEWDLLKRPDDWTTATPEELNQLVFDAGIVGLGGALFPTHIKLKNTPDRPIDTFILNGCECEPYLTCDHRMMVESADKILLGVAIKLKILGIKNAYIAIENNKPDAIVVMQQRVKALGYDFKVMPLQVKYPQGAEKMLIQAVLNRQVPAGGLPGDVGVIVNNVGTALAIAEAVTEGKPLISRVVTVTGDSVMNPKNVLARVGTPFKNALDFAGGYSNDASQLIMGGPMMGMSQFDTAVPIIKGTSGIIVRSARSNKKRQVYPCISCGSCVGACPMFLLPNRLSRYSEINAIDEIEKLGLMNCIECGSCVFVCPSHIPILQWIRVGKFRARERAATKAAS